MCRLCPVQSLCIAGSPVCGVCVCVGTYSRKVRTVARYLTQESVLCRVLFRVCVCVRVCPCSNYNENVDCYSAAMVLWYMCMADRPFGDLDADLIMAGAANGLRPELSCIERRHGKIMSAAIKNCWEADPAKRHSAEQLLEAMREQLQYIEAKKARRRLPASIYRWASSAANRVSAAIASSKKGPSLVHEGKLPDTAADAAHRPVDDAEGRVPHTASVQNRSFSDPWTREEERRGRAGMGGRAGGGERGSPASARRESSGSSLDKTSGSHASLGNLDGTNTTVTTTGTWSLDNTNNSVTTNNTANTNNLDGTANSTVSVLSASDDWFSQVAQERQRAQSPASVEGDPVTKMSRCKERGPRD